MHALHRLCDLCRQIKLLANTTHHLLFDGTLGTELIYGHLLCLSNAMSSSFSLKCNLRIPIFVKENDVLGAREIDTQATCPCRQKHDLVV